MKKFIGRKEDVFLLVSIILVVYAIFYVLMYHNLKLDSEQKKYGNQLDFTIYSDNELSDDVDIINYFFGDLKTDINYSIKEWNIYIGNSLDSYDVTLELNKSEDDNNDNIVAIGKDLSNICKEVSGNTCVIQVFNKQHQAIILPKEPTISNYDNRAYIYYYNASDEFKKQINKELLKTLDYGMLHISLKSDNYLSEEYDKIKEKCEKYNMRVTIDKNKFGINYIDVIFKKMGEIFSKIVCFFALVNCIAISVTWFECHKQEMIIRRAFGYTRTDLYKYIAENWAKLIGIAFALIEFIEIVIGIYNKSLINETKVFVENSLLSFVIVSGFISIIVIWQIQVIMRINIKKLLLK